MSIRRVAAILFCVLLFSPQLAQAFNTYGSIRYRTEVVDQQTIARDGVANTLRLRGGLVTAPLAGFSALVEGTGVATIGPRQSSNAAQPDSRYPTINDPQNLDITQAAIRYRPNIPILGPDFDRISLRLGRQRIAHGNQRFIGPVGFRQTQQTFDAASLSLEGYGGWFLDYDYIWQVRRVVGRRSDNGLGSLDADSHIFHGSYRGINAWRFTAYAYLFDVENDAFDLATYGGSARHTWQRDTTEFTVRGEAAYQRPDREQPSNRSYHYAMLDAQARHGPWTVNLGLEQLSGDALGAFQTPFATLHKFQGATDRFLTTPANGVTDGYMTLAYMVHGSTFGAFEGAAIPHVRLSGGAHEFRDGDGARHLGREYSLTAAMGFKNATRILLQGARYMAGDFSQDTDKFWLSFEAEF